MGDPVISVIITTYNHESYIAQAIGSVLAQRECPSCEIIIGEDCSTDNTRLVIEAFAKKDKRIRVLNHNPNIGLQQNLKACIDVCRGQYIAICEGDDIWIDECKLNKQYEILKNNASAVMCFSDINLLFEDGTTSNHYEDIKKSLPGEITAKEVIIYNGLSATFSCCMYTAQVVETVPQSFFEKREGFDFLFNLYVLEHGCGIFLKDICVNYRIHRHGLWSGKSIDEKINETVKSLCAYNKEFNYKYNVYFKECIISCLSVNLEVKAIKKEPFRELFSISIPWPKQRILKISIQGGRKK